MARHRTARISRNENRDVEDFAIICTFTPQVEAYIEDVSLFTQIKKYFISSK